MRNISNSILNLRVLTSRVHLQLQTVIQCVGAGGAGGAAGGDAAGGAGATASFASALRGEVPPLPALETFVFGV